MGRELKRVPLDFDWPVGKVWAGYLFSTCIDDCDDCKKAAKLMGYDVSEHGCPDYPGFHPPEGEGFQLWETTSEGSPISPVFSTAEKLAEYLEAEKVSSFASITCNYDQWLDFIKGPGWAPSAIIKNGVLSSGVCST